MTKPGDSPDAATVLARPKPADATSTDSPPTESDAALSRPPALAGGTTVGRYVIEEPLGEGGMGVVYVAHDPELGRDVALKLLRPEVLEDGSDGRSRLVREAHAMAKLNHPNVVAIYDAGVYGDQVFLAVELVDGPTLKGWLRLARTWREILDVFGAAGKGLVAAHEAGLVHRDFKPENVLIGRNHDVKVADFGLARAASKEQAEPEVATATDLAADPILATPLTRAGLVAGTPAYMAPEQFRGGGGDARTDEFSFCVALYRSLYGELPFAGRITASTQIRSAPKGTRVPMWVRRAVMRGLSFRPEDRYPTMRDLLAALADDPAIYRRRLIKAATLAAVLLATIAITTMLVIRHSASSDPCADPEAKLAGAWDDAVRSRVQAAFAASGAPDAVNTAAYAVKAMDRASNAWVAAYRNACEATRVSHTQPEAALQLRIDCLDDQRFGLRAAGEIMSNPDANNLASAIGAANALPLPLECADAHVLSVIEQPSASLRDQVDTLRSRLARGRALSGAAKYREALAVLGGLPDEAKALGAPALQANALAALGAAYGELYDSAKAIDTYTLAERVAVEAHMDSLATQAAASVVIYMSMHGNPHTDVVRWLDRARDDLRRAGSGTTAEYYVQRAIGYAGADAGAGDDHTGRVLELAEQLFGSDRPETLHAANEHAVNLARIGRYDDSVALLRKAIANADSMFGPHNQRALLPQVNLAEILCDLGRTAEAEQAVAALFARLGSDEAIHAAVGFAVQAVLRAEQGQTAESLHLAGRATEVATKLGMVTNPNWSPDLHRHTIEAYLRVHQAKVALDEYQRYRESYVATDTPDDVNDLRLGGWAYLDAGQPEQAIPILERALERGSAHPLVPSWVARLRFQLAKALVLTQGDRVRARALARAAHDELATIPAAKDLLDELDAWTAKAFAL